MKTRGQKLKLFSGYDIKEKDINFGLSANLDKETKFDFKLSGNLEEETFLIAMDKILDFLKEQKVEKKYSGQNLMTFDNEKNEWTVINIYEEIKKIHANQNGH